MTECPACQARDVYKFTQSLCCWVRFFEGLPDIPNEDGLTTQDFWINLLRKADKAPLADAIAKALKEENQ